MLMLLTGMPRSAVLFAKKALKETNSWTSQKIPVHGTHARESTCSQGIERRGLNVNGFHTPQPTGIALRQNTHSITARSQMLKKRQDFAGRFLFPVKDGRIMPKNLAEQGRKPRRPTVDMKSCQTVQRIQRVNLLYCFWWNGRRKESGPTCFWTDVSWRSRKNPFS